MTFYVEKRLPLGRISFGVLPGRKEEPVDDGTLSTGPSGEFVRHRSEGFFFGGHDPFAAPVLPALPSVRSTPFIVTLKEARWLLLLLPCGALFFFLGLAVVARKGPQGWIEVILGLAMIGVPIVLTVQKRKQIREQEERERTEREATERRNREMLDAYTSALERAMEHCDEETLQQLFRESTALALPYEIWGAAARRTVLLAGFEELARRGPAESREVARTMDRFSRAAGLAAEDQAGVKLDLYRTIVWHQLADESIGEPLRMIRDGFGFVEGDVSAEMKAAEEFGRLRGMTPQTLPRVRCAVPLGFQEHCIHETPSDQGTLHVTNRRIVVEGQKPLEIPVTRAFDIVVNADDGSISLKSDKQPLRLRVAEPIYTAAILDLATQIDERPRGFA